MIAHPAMCSVSAAKPRLWVVARASGWPNQVHGCPVERTRLLVARSIQLEIPLAGLVPATHVFERGFVDGREGVAGRDKPGQGEQKVVPVFSAPLCSRGCVVA